MLFEYGSQESLINLKGSKTQLKMVSTKSKEPSSDFFQCSLNANVRQPFRYMYATRVCVCARARASFEFEVFHRFLVYKYEVGGWAPPTDLSQSFGAAAHTYTWFSLMTYLLTLSLLYHYT